MHVFNRHQRLVKILEAIQLIEFFILMKPIEQIPVLSVLNNNIKLPFILKQIIKLYDIIIAKMSMD